MTEQLHSVAILFHQVTAQINFRGQKKKKLVLRKSLYTLKCNAEILKTLN